MNGTYDHDFDQMTKVALRILIHYWSKQTMYITEYEINQINEWSNDDSNCSRSIMNLKHLLLLKGYSCLSIMTSFIYD